MAFADATGSTCPLPGMGLDGLPAADTLDIFGPAGLVEKSKASIIAMRLQKLASHLDNEELYILLMLFILLQDAPTIRMEDVLKFIYKMVLIKIQSLYCLENFDEARNLLSTFINEMTQFKNCMYHYLNIK